MDASQQFNHVNENNYDDDVTISGIPKGYFPAITSNVVPEGSDTREVIVDIMPLEQSPGGTMPVNTGLYIRQEKESCVKVTVLQDGKEIATNTANYN